MWKRCTRCEELLPIEQFSKRSGRPGFEAWCKPCKSRAQCQRAANRVRPKPYFTEWHDGWIEIEKRRIAKLMGAARKFAFDEGHGWFADEFAQHAAIEFAQGNKVYFRTLLIELLRHYCGKTGSARNRMTWNDIGGIGEETHS